jgi:DNA-binding transcriptional LysR family regulator
VVAVDWMQPMRIFVCVVQNGSLSSAGRQLGLSPASVSRHISALEESLGCRLLNRTSRKLALTEAGELYYAKVEQILQQIVEANEGVAQLHTHPRGTLRVHSRVLVGHLHVVPMLPDYLALYPEVKVDLAMSNRVIDIVEQNVDVDIRIGKLVDSSLVARKLAGSERLLCATPGYLARHPPITRPADFATHNCMTYRVNVGRTIWRFLDPGGALEESPGGGSLSSDNGYALLTAALAGVGIALMPDWAVSGDIAEGRLTQLLPEYRVSYIDFDNGIYAVFQKSRYLSAKVRSFIDFLAESFASRLR